MRLVHCHLLRSLPSACLIHCLYQTRVEPSCSIIGIFSEQGLNTSELSRERKSEHQWYIEVYNHQAKSFFSHHQSTPHPIYYAPKPLASITTFPLPSTQPTNSITMSAVETSRLDGKVALVTGSGKFSCYTSEISIPLTNINRPWYWQVYGH